MAQRKLGCAEMIQTRVCLQKFDICGDYKLDIRPCSDV